MVVAGNLCAPCILREVQLAPACCTLGVSEFASLREISHSAECCRHCHMACAVDSGNCFMLASQDVSLALLLLQPTLSDRVGGCFFVYTRWLVAMCTCRLWTCAGCRCSAASGDCDCDGDDMNATAEDMYTAGSFDSALS